MAGAAGTAVAVPCEMIVKLAEGEAAGDGAIGVTSWMTPTVGTELPVVAIEVAETVDAADAIGVAGCAVVIVVCVAVAG